MASRSFKTKLTTKGPFFTGDPSKTLADNIHLMMLAIAREGAKDVRGQLRMGTAKRAPVAVLGGRVADRVTGELRRYPSGAPYTARVMVRNRGLTRPQGIALMAASSFLESTVHAFRKTRGRILRARAVNAAALLKGLT